MLGIEASIVQKKIAEDQAAKMGVPKSVVMNWLRTQISFASLPGNFRCLFGSRQSFYHHKTTQFENGVSYFSQIQPSRVMNDF